MVVSELNKFALVATVLAVILDVLLSRSGQTNQPSYKIAIGILSARENFVQREAVRSSWLRALNHSNLKNKIFYAFVLANKDCDIPADFRKLQYTCDEIQFPQHGNFSTLQYTIDVHKAGQAPFYVFPSQYAIVAWDFTVILDIIVNGFLTPNSHSQIELWDLASDELVLKSTATQVVGKESVMQHRTCKRYLLPRGFVGSILCFCPVYAHCLGIKDAVLSHFAVKVSPILRYSESPAEFPDVISPTNLLNLYPAAVLTFNLPDPNEFVNLYVKGKIHAYKQKQLDSLAVQQKLLLEKKAFNDLVILPNIDGKSDLIEVYANLPRKVISTYHWMQKHVNTEYLMKVDDDSYVDPERLYKLIDDVESIEEHSDTPLWLGKFRHDWVVDRYGKWAEYQYSASKYPSFACGSGYVLSSAASIFLTLNADRLQFYQGEDVSMGIWLASIRVKKIEVESWMCDDACEQNMIVSAQHRPESLRRLWSNKIDCGNPCSCSTI